MEYVKGPHNGHKKLFHELEFEAEKLSNSLNPRKCSEMLTNFWAIKTDHNKNKYEHSTLNMCNIKTNSIDFVALLRMIEIDFF